MAYILHRDQLPLWLSDFGVNSVIGPDSLEQLTQEFFSLLEQQMQHRRPVKPFDPKRLFQDYHVFWVGGQEWGDEGKGRWTDSLLAKLQDEVPDAQIAVVRYQGGHNAGHTVEYGGQKFEHHVLPSGITHKGAICIMGAGMVISPKQLLLELNELDEKVGRDNYANLLISERSNVIMPWHEVLDAMESGSIGTTGRGIGPAYESEANRNDKISFGLFYNKSEQFNQAVRDISRRMRGRLVGNLFTSFLTGKLNREFLSNFTGMWEKLDPNEITQKYAQLRETLYKYGPKVTVRDETLFLDTLVQKGGYVVLEGSQGVLLDKIRGTAPYVTSSPTGPGGAPIGAIPFLDNIFRIGVGKSMSTRVGGGALPTQSDITSKEIYRRFPDARQALEGRDWTKAEEYTFYRALAEARDPVQALASDETQQLRENLKRVKENPNDKAAKDYIRNARADYLKIILPWMKQEIQNDESLFGVYVRLIGEEYGVTTGRPRRNGYKDMVALDYSVKVSNPDALAITKLDVLSGLPDVRLCVGYIQNGTLVKESDILKPLGIMPEDADSLYNIEPVYIEMPGWPQDLSNMRNFEELKNEAPNAHRFIEFMAAYTGLPVMFAGVGAQREQYISGYLT